MMFMIILHLFIIALFLLLGWALKYKRAYWLISGFQSRSKEEQEKLIANGYPQRTGSLFLYTGMGMLLLLPLTFTSFPYAIEVLYGFMMLFLLGGLIYVSKFEVLEKRKRSYMISIATFILIIGGIGGITAFSYQGYDLQLKEEQFEVTGLYGKEWSYAEIKSVTLVDEMPRVTLRQNGIGLPTLSQGKFKVEGYENSRLFIQKHVSPYMVIELENETIFINHKEPSTTRLWYELLQSAR
jgi:hypothetical protein